VRAIGDEALHHGFARRLTGGNSTDTEGLLAAVLIITVLYGNLPTRRWARFMLLALGVAGLALTRSVGAVVAVGLVVGLVQPVRKDELIKRALLRPLRIVLLVLAAIVAVVSLRPQNLPSSSNFNEGSTEVRLMAGAAGLVVFAHHPLLGVGFARSADPSILDTQQTSAPLHRWFPGQPASFYPDGQNLSSVHNAYVQTAAEEGLVGLAVLLLVASTVGSRLRTVRRSLADIGERADFQWACCMLAAVLIWWNDNPLFGAQPETVTAAVAIGVLGSFWARGSSRRSATAVAAAA
jgi:O-antigen ligase